MRLNKVLVYMKYVNKTCYRIRDERKKDSIDEDEISSFLDVLIAQERRLENAYLQATMGVDQTSSDFISCFKMVSQCRNVVKAARYGDDFSPELIMHDVTADTECSNVVDE